jgi:hypothetical protein
MVDKPEIYNTASRALLLPKRSLRNDPRGPCLRLYKGNFSPVEWTLHHAGQIHVILDHLNRHKSKQVRWPILHAGVLVHFIPAHRL